MAAVETVAGIFYYLRYIAPAFEGVFGGWCVVRRSGLVRDKRGRPRGRQEPNITFRSDVESVDAASAGQSSRGCVGIASVTQSCMPPR